MAYTKYSLTPANNNAAPPDGAPEGMLPSAVNDTMRDMMAQIRDCGDGIRGGTYTMTAPVITGGSINGAAIGATTASTGAFTTLSASSTVSGTGFSNYFASPPALGGTAAAAVSSTNLSYTGTLTGGTGVVNLGSGQFYKDASGNVLVGTSGAIGKLAVVSPSSGYSLVMQGSSADGQSILSSMDRSGTVYTGNLIFPEDGSIVFGRLNTGSNTERMRIDSDGNLIINNTTQFGSAKVSVKYVPGASTGVCFLATTDASGPTPLIFLNAAGSAVGSVTTTGSATAYNTSSDYRLKENIAPMQNALNVVQQLKPVTYTWKSTGEASQGFIAHELQAVVPDCVTGEKDAVDEEGKPVYQGIDASFLVATLTKAIQEQQVMIDELKAKVAALEAA